MSVSCLEEAELLIVHGANHICQSTGPWLGGALGAVAAAALVLGVVRRSPRVLILFAALAGAGALPGLYAIVGRRADRPGAFGRTGELVESRLQTFASFASRHACVDIVDLACTSCQPIAQMSFEACDGRTEGAGQAMLGVGGLTAPCVTQGALLRCGR